MEVSDAPTLCQVCGLPLAIGDWPCVTRVRPHGKSVQTGAFVPYFDVALGREITSLGDRWQSMKEERDPKTGDVIRGKLDYRDKMSPGELSARRDRLEQQHQARERAARG